MVLRSCFRHRRGKPGSSTPGIIKDHKPGDQPAEVTERLFTPLGTEVFATAWHANIIITSNGETVTAATEHEKRVPPTPN